MTTALSLPFPEPVSRGDRVLIVGGSTRAAAWSAARAGLRPVCADLFADQDTREIAEIVPVCNYPDTLPDDVARVSAHGWFYTGALENRPDLIAKLDQPAAPYGSLWGASIRTIGLVRDPLWLHETLRATGAIALDVLPDSTPPPADGSWVQKPLASAGGRAVRIWNQEARNIELTEPHYFQRRIAGEPMSAVFRVVNSEAILLGCTQQLIGDSRTRAPHPFAYCGSIGPIHVDVSLQESIRQIGQSIAINSGMHGVFGVDFLLCQSDSGKRDPCVIEINPRYPASLEILELAQQRSLLGPLMDTGLRATSVVIAKMVLYSRHTTRAPDLCGSIDRTSLWGIPQLADIPVPGMLIEQGWPICTIYAVGRTADESRQTLERKVIRFWEHWEQLCFRDNMTQKPGKGLSILPTST